jgi:hypothetical protein
MVIHLPILEYAMICQVLFTASFGVMSYLIDSFLIKKSAHFITRIYFL